MRWPVGSLSPLVHSRASSHQARHRPYPYMSLHSCHPIAAARMRGGAAAGMWGCSFGFRPELTAEPGESAFWLMTSERCTMPKQPPAERKLTLSAPHLATRNKVFGRSDNNETKCQKPAGQGPAM